MTALQVFAVTHKGAVRTVNEDHILLGEIIEDDGSLFLEINHGDPSLVSGLLLAVADGIGGEQGGATASRQALERFRKHFLEALANGFEVSSAIEVAGERANRALMDMTLQNPDLNGMGCTLCGVHLRPPEVHVFNCGDSRVYRLRNGFLKRLTEDHTFASEAVRQGRLSTAEADRSELNHHLTNHLGLASCRMVVEKGPDLRCGDTLLVCSDGLYDLVDEEAITDLATDSDTLLEKIGEELVDQAMVNGGHDNISIILARAID